jgi:stress-induced morphogen
MMTFEDLSAHIKQTLADAEVSITDRTGTMDHFTIKVISDEFKEKNLLDRHRLIYQALDAPMKDGRIHALEIQAKTRDEAKGG